VAKAATSTFVSSFTQIQCRLPSHNIGFADITVTTPSGGRATLQDAVIYSKLTFNSLLITEAVVVRVIDGDTIEVDIEGNLFSVRYIGIDTPETVHPTKGEEPYGREASDKNKELVEGKIVLLEKDISETDQYGRLLRYVYTEDVFVNAELVRLGYAQVSTYPPDVMYQELFLDLQREAREAGYGLWGLGLPNEPPVNQPGNSAGVLITDINYDGIVPQVESDEYVEITNSGNEAVNLANWTLMDISEGYPTFVFPSYILQSGMSIRVYTNEIHPEYGGFSFGYGSAIWNNTNPDVAVLLDAQGNLIYQASY
jgi:micrococcal nuclease